MGLSYATSQRGACHLRTTFYKLELSGDSDPQVVEGKTEMLVDYEDRLTIFDCLILCKFFRDLVMWDDLAELVRVTTGLTLDQTQLRQLANRVTTETRLFNREAGMDREADTLPSRFLTEPVNEAGHRLTREELDYMLEEYYRLRGWDELL